MNRNSGFSLLETAIAMGIMAVGLSGLCALLIKSASGTASISHRGQAVAMAAGLKADLAMAPAGAAALLDVAGWAPACEAVSPCTPAGFVGASLGRLQYELGRALPGGRFSICRDATPQDGIPDSPDCDGAGPIVIKIFWLESAADTTSWGRVSQELAP